MNTTDTFETIWPRLVIPAEYDSMDECDQTCWKMALRQAYEMGIAGGTAPTADTFAWAIRKPDGTLYNAGRLVDLWTSTEGAQNHLACYPTTLAGCTVVKVRITTDLGEAP
jgi:hypothetical protein